MAFEFELKCASCGAAYARDRVVFTCDACPGLLDVVGTLPKDARSVFSGSEAGLWKYASLLPFGDFAGRVSLGEGGTPLIRSERLARDWGVKNLFFKCEHVSPTASFKDRGMSAAITAAAALGVKEVYCASTGNTAASLSAYAARAGLKAVLVLPAHVPLGKLSQSILHAPLILRVPGGFDYAMALVTEIGRRGHYLINSINPYRVEAQKTAAFEIVGAMAWKVPDHVILPAGSGGFLTALHKGFREMKKIGITAKLPKLGAVQAESVSPVVNALRCGGEVIPVSGHVATIAGGINIGAPVHGREAVKAVRETGGIAEVVSDAEILSAQDDLARGEGIGVEPTGAVAVAGLKKALTAKTISPDQTIVCVLTGHALKDPSAVMERATKEIAIRAGDDADAVLKKISRT